MPILNIFLRGIDVINDITGKSVSYLMTFSIGVLITGIMRRYVFNNPWAYETITSNFLTAYVILGAGFAFRNGAFVNIDILHRRIPLRIKAIIDMFTHVLFFLFCFTIIKESIPEALDTLSIFRPSVRQLLSPARWPVKLFYPIGVTLLYLQGLAKFARDFITAVTGEELV